MFLPAWTVWRIQNIDRMKLSWRPWEKVEGLKEQTQKRINHHLISKGHPQMLQSEGALCFTTPKAEHYVLGWKQVLKMSGGWLDIQVWKKWNRKLDNKKTSWAKMTRTQKRSPRHYLFHPLEVILTHAQSTTCLSDSIPTCVVAWDCFVGFYCGSEKPFFCEGVQVIAVRCWNALYCFQNRLQVFFLQLLYMTRSRFWGIYKSWFSPPSFLKAGSHTHWYVKHLNDASVSRRDYLSCSSIKNKLSCASAT